ncbi:4'-phosphopantetheinyl transferase family protein [Actinomyces ruminicola]|uniref:4'-phosphopantetheinyl transferase EntD (Siderophore biosynthesis) n=1 Tax=Actinomyces ruminicola TaxID=332524 RepID=A0A1G9RPD8_9ACTO|nr:4'-phosphopantetheinyl transferase superfamily protein [Actinomyces ruminicola]SDM25062.1 4'-phosphopantetheinyl transferase EntD (siderophore biosynthesis) [Actinomyces ruminicola]
MAAPESPAAAGTHLLAALVPPSVRVAEANHDVDAPLLPPEAAHISGASERRRAEFTTVRHLAGRALAELGVARPAMVPGPMGEPTWPDDVVGSLTHCLGYRAAAVARASEVTALGIDAEPSRPLARGVLERIAYPGERENVCALAEALPGVAGDRLLFSIKEAVYKAWFPRAPKPLRFADAAVDIRPDGAFMVGLATGTDGCTELTGRWAAGGDLLVSAVAMKVSV